MFKNEKPLVFGETKGLIKSCEHRNYNALKQEIQPAFEFSEIPTKPKPLRIIQCHDCKKQSELDGYRFALVPICKCCRTNREVEITGNRFERRHRKR